MELFDQLFKTEYWMDFLEYKRTKGNLSKNELLDLEQFVMGKEYLASVEKLERTYELEIPSVIEINKKGTNKKRVVFTFGREENYVLKMIAFLLKSYDHLFADNLYSFRQNTGVKRAVFSLVRNVDIAKCYAYKVDIHDYFNSVDTEGILALFQQHLPAERKLYKLFANLLRNPYARKEEKLLEVRKGIMAGVPISGFLANLYLMELDAYFAKNDISYIRYSDDIIVFAGQEEELAEYERIIKNTLAKKNLIINEKKEYRFQPGDRIEFLGFEFFQDDVRVADISVQKLKGKMKRKARAIYRWKIRNQVPDEKAALAYIRFLNRKFYENPIHGEITWCRWYFPVITKEDKLKSIDQYAIDCIRYVYYGSYGKKKYNLRYDKIQELGFQSLVYSYWRFRNRTYGEEER